MLSLINVLFNNLPRYPNCGVGSCFSALNWKTLASVLRPVVFLSLLLYIFLVSTNSLHYIFFSTTEHTKNYFIDVVRNKIFIVQVGLNNNTGMTPSLITKWRKLTNTPFKKQVFMGEKPLSETFIDGTSIYICSTCVYLWQYPVKERRHVPAAIFISTKWCPVHSPL